MSRRPIFATFLFFFVMTGSLAAQSGATQSGSKARAGQKPVWPDEGAAVWAPRPTEDAITANDLRTRLYGFADDSLQGRRIGEVGNFKGTAYIGGEFERLGLHPAGEDGTFFQDMPYGPIAFDSAASRLRIGGKAVVAGRDWVPVAPSAFNGLGDGAVLTDLPTVFAGTWGESTTLDPEVFRGKVAVFVGGPTAGGGFRGGSGAATLPRCDMVPNRFGAEAAVVADTMNGGRNRRSRGAIAPPDTRARDAGAIAILFVDLDDDSARATSAFAARNTMQPERSPAGVPAGASITGAVAERLFGHPLEELTVGAAGNRVSGGWSYAWHASEWPARNVIAILPGSDPLRAGEYVLVSAHNDHVGINRTVFDHDSLRAVNMVTRRQGANDPSCIPTADQQRRIDSLIAHARSIRAPRKDSIMNGADDDGSGTVILLEIAEKFAKEHPARSIIFVSHEGEEAGLLGSRWFTDHPTIPLDSVVGAFNMDMEAKGHVDQVRFGGPTSIQILGARRLSRELGDVIDSVNAIRPRVMAIDGSWDVPANPMNRFCRSDQVNYVHHDVPVAYLSTGYAYDYHQATDEPQYADYDHMAVIGDFVHEVMTAVANREQRLSIAGADPNYPTCR